MTVFRLPRATLALTVLALVVVTAWAVWSKLPSSATGVDDANIFFAYARHVSAGEGFVFNAGAERVEGFTSLLWVLICSAAVGLAGDPERPLLALNVLLVSLTILCCFRSFVVADTSDDGTLSKGWAVALLGLLLSDFSYVAWSTVTLMETALWGALLALAALTILRDGHRGGSAILATLVALMVLTRPEALVWVPSMIALCYLRRVVDTSHASALRTVAAPALTFVVTTLILTIFRLSYFGYPLPNTYYAKVPPSAVYTANEGVKYLWSYLRSAPIPFACALAVVVSAVHVVAVRLSDTRTLTLTGLSAVGLIVPVLTGGDRFDGFRFYQPVYPLLLLTLLNCVRFVIPRYIRLPNSPAWRRVRLAGTTLALGLFLSLQIVEWIHVDRRAVLGFEFEIASVGRERGRQANALFEALQPPPSIGTITVGGLKYIYEGDVIDLMGLNSTMMAHNGGDRIGVRSHAAFEEHTFYKLNPNVVVPLVQFSESLSSVGQPNLFVTSVLKGLLQTPRFRKLYQLAEVRKMTPEGVVMLPGWYDRAFLARLEQSRDFHIVTQP